MATTPDTWQPTFRYFGDQDAAEMNAKYPDHDWAPSWPDDALTAHWTPSVDWQPDVTAECYHLIYSNGKLGPSPIAFGLHMDVAHRICDLHNAALDAARAE